MRIMEPILDPFWMENIERAKRQTMEEKLRDSGDLFDMACEVTLCGIRNENPGISDAAALDILRQRLQLAKQLEGRLGEVSL